MTQEQLWDLAYSTADTFLKVGLDTMKAAGYIIEYNEATGEFNCIPPWGDMYRETENDYEKDNI